MNEEKEGEEEDEIDVKNVFSFLKYTCIFTYRLIINNIWYNETYHR